VKTEKGITGLPPGTRVTRISESGGTVRVTDGVLKFDVLKYELTTDPRVAARLAQGDALSQSGVSQQVLSENAAEAKRQSRTTIRDEALKELDAQIAVQRQMLSVTPTSKTWRVDAINGQIEKLEQQRDKLLQRN
jgi:hypothetical protein